MQPIWNYIARNKIATKPRGTHDSLKKPGNALTHDKTALIQRWAEWVTQRFQQTKERETPDPLHIKEHRGEQIQENKHLEQQIPPWDKTNPG